MASSITNLLHVYKNLFYANSGIGSWYPSIVLRICLSAYNFNEIFFLAETYPRVHISFPLTSGSIVRKRRQWRVGRGNVSRRSLRLSVEYVGSLRVVVTSDGHTMLISFEIFNQIDLSIELLSIPVDYVKF